jgi:hypothetical protein
MTIGGLSISRGTSTSPVTSSRSTFPCGNVRGGLCSRIQYAMQDPENQFWEGGQSPSREAWRRSCLVRSHARHGYCCKALAVWRAARDAWPGHGSRRSVALMPRRPHSPVWDNTASLAPLGGQPPMRAHARRRRRTSKLCGSGIPARHHARSRSQFGEALLARTLRARPERAGVARECL